MRRIKALGVGVRLCVWAFVCWAVILISCKKDDTVPEPEAVRVILVYMLSDNSLGQQAVSTDDLKEMRQAVASKDVGNARVLVYHDAATVEPTLSELVCTNGEHASMKVLRKYKRRNSARAEVLGEVIADAERLVPSINHGLILWSHALGWLPPAVGSDDELKSFGDDGGQEMDIVEMCNAIPDGYYDFISADACYMGGIEIAYQLRHKTALYIAPPTEILFAGMPYQTVLPMLCRERIDADALCRAVYDYYAKRGEPVALACVDTQALEAVAQCAKTVMAEGYKDVGYATTYSEDFEECFVDMAEVLELHAAEIHNSAKVDVRGAVAEAVVAFRHTDSFYELDLTGDCCGISMADYGNCSEAEQAYLRQYDWWKNCLPEAGE